MSNYTFHHLTILYSLCQVFRYQQNRMLGMRLDNSESYPGVCWREGVLRLLRYQVQEFKRWSGGGWRFRSDLKAKRASTPRARGKQALWQARYSEIWLLMLLSNISKAGTHWTKQLPWQPQGKVISCSKSKGMATLWLRCFHQVLSYRVRSGVK